MFYSANNYHRKTLNSILNYSFNSFIGKHFIAKALNQLKYLGKFKQKSPRTALPAPPVVSAQNNFKKLFLSPTPDRARRSRTEQICKFNHTFSRNF